MSEQPPVPPLLSSRASSLSAYEPAQALNEDRHPGTGDAEGDFEQKAGGPPALPQSSRSDALAAGAGLAIHVQNLRKVYGEGKDAKAAVDGLNLSVRRGSFFGFLGPNGAGKTTTIKMLMGLAPPTSGSIELLGLPMPAQALEIKKKIGLVPDESLLFDQLTGGEFMEFTGRIYGLEPSVARERTRELLALFEMDNAPKRLIREYSKGMRKRVAMAAALIHRPELFLLDEPFEGVDAVGARLMKSILQDLVRGGATIFLTSHVLEVVERLCDSIAIINHGKIVTEGPIELLRGEGTLEEAFVRAVGLGEERGTLDWL